MGPFFLPYSWGIIEPQLWAKNKGRTHWPCFPDVFKSCLHQLLAKSSLDFEKSNVEIIFSKASGMTNCCFLKKKNHSCSSRGTYHLYSEKIFWCVSIFDYWARGGIGNNTHFISMVQVRRWLLEYGVFLSSCKKQRGMHNSLKFWKMDGLQAKFSLWGLVLSSSLGEPAPILVSIGTMVKVLPTFSFVSIF